MSDRHSTDVVVVGTGRLGSALVAAMVEAGYGSVHVARVRGRDAAAHVGLAPPVPLEDVGAGYGLAFLAVPDAAVRDVAAAFGASPPRAVVHCSGALGLDVLAGPAAAGATAGTLHPLQTFPADEPPADAARRFRGIVCGVEAAEPLGSTLEAIAADLGATSVRLEGIDRAAYHAAAVLASNDVVALMAAAGRTWALAGLPPEAARAALAPLMLAAAQNVRALPLERALTGPIARGDVDTVRRHLTALAAQPELRELYRGLALELLALDLRHDAPTVEALRRALETDR